MFRHVTRVAAMLIVALVWDVNKNSCTQLQQVNAVKLNRGRGTVHPGGHGKHTRLSTDEHDDDDDDDDEHTPSLKHHAPPQPKRSTAVRRHAKPKEKKEELYANYRRQVAQVDEDGTVHIERWVKYLTVFLVCVIIWLLWMTHETSSRNEALLRQIQQNQNTTRTS